MDRSILVSWKAALLLGLLAALLLLATCRDIGLTWDEADYMVASESYVAWIQQLLSHPREALREASIAQHWEESREHPPLDKLISGVVWLLARHALDDFAAHRLGNMLLAGLLIAFLFRLVALEFGFWAGLLSALTLLGMPRFFFHAHLANLDVPVTAMMVIVSYVFWRTREDPRFRSTLLLGIAWGLAISTKLNALFHMPALAIWALLFCRRGALFLRLLLASAIGLALFVLLWPWQYVHTLEHLREYVAFMVEHIEIQQYYLGQVHMPPPWHFPFVMLIAVVPAATMLLSLAGGVRSLVERRKRAFGGLLALGALVPLAVLASGRTMVYDNERLFMPTFPFVAALAGIGFDWVRLRLGEAPGRRMRPATSTSPLIAAAPAVATALLTALTVVPTAYHAARLHPHLLSYYSGAVGGLPGASRMGLETTYWCETYGDAIAYINRHAEPGDVIWAPPFSYGVLGHYQQHGVLRQDLRLAATVAPEDEQAEGRATGRASRENPAQADFVIFPYRQTGFYSLRKSILPFVRWAEQQQPVYRLERCGVPIMDIYAPPRP